MISRAGFIVAVCLLVAACESVVGFDYRVASKDPKVTSAQMLRVVTDALDRAEARAWAQIDEKTGEVTFTLGAFGSGKTPSIRNVETRCSTRCATNSGSGSNSPATASHCADGAHDLSLPLS
jgi:hypothetical protein